MSEQSLNWSDKQLICANSHEECMREAYELGAPICYHLVDPTLPVLCGTELTIDRLDLLRSYYVSWRPIGKVDLKHVARVIWNQQINEHLNRSYDD